MKVEQKELNVFLLTLSYKELNKVKDIAKHYGLSITEILLLLFDTSIFGKLKEIKDKET